MNVRSTIPVFSIALAALSLAVTGCTRSTAAPIADPAVAKPNVVMAANPRPPFTYWAPEGSTIRNHPSQPGIWVAEATDGGRKFYFGDRCRASEFQRYVGRSVDTLPEKPADAKWRLTCSTCVATSDLHWERMNVSYDQETRTISEISCG